jgi:regulator of protease activity HflC (stomatin/prohibitin superfamily)
MNYGPAVTFGFIAVVLAISGLKVLPEYERAVIFRLGRLVASRGPGVIYVVPLIG